MRRVFITGGAGFIGSHILQQLAGNGVSSFIYDDFSSTISTESQLLHIYDESPAELIIAHGDVRDHHELIRAMDEFKPDLAIHLAAMVSVPLSVDQPEECHEINYRGTENFIRAAKEAGVENLVYSSTAAVYGNRIPPLYEEDADDSDSQYLQSLLSPYARTKLEGERLIRESGIPSLIFRFFNVYGERQSITGGYPAVVPRFIQGILKEGFITIYGDGRQTRDFIYAGDIASGIIQGVKSGKQGVYNLGTGRVKSLLDLVETLRLVTDKDFEVNYAPSRKGDITHSYCNVDRIKREIGFEAQTTFEAGLNTTFEYYRTNGFGV